MTATSLNDLLPLGFQTQFCRWSFKVSTPFCNSSHDSQNSIFRILLNVTLVFPYHIIFISKITDLCRITDIHSSGLQTLKNLELVVHQHHLFYLPDYIGLSNNFFFQFVEVIPLCLILPSSIALNTQLYEMKNNQELILDYKYSHWLPL